MPSGIPFFCMDFLIEETREFWDRTAEDWKLQVGTHGDRNRLLNSDPVLWAFAGDVEGRRVLDAGCGTGYLSRKLQARGAQVTGVDFSEKMIALARQDAEGIDFRVDSCESLDTCATESFHLLVSNYVLMDLPDLEAAVNAFYRVLQPGGRAVLVFSHPCFPASAVVKTQQGRSYVWKENYFARHKRVDPPWGHFTSHFIWFHRPLSDYWKTFAGAGFRVSGFEEPRLRPELADLATTKERSAFVERPYSVVFQLEKPA